MEKFTIEYNITFVSGNLSGLSTACKLDYPMSSKKSVVRQMENDISSKRIIESTSSYFITSYEVIDHKCSLEAI